MTNKEAYEKLFPIGLYEYDYSKDAMYYYPCDDRHGMFYGEGCNCTTKINRKYLNQEFIDRKIAKYEQV